MALLAGRPLKSNSRARPTLTDRTVATVIGIGFSFSQLQISIDLCQKPGSRLALVDPNLDQTSGVLANCLLASSAAGIAIAAIAAWPRDAGALSFPPAS